MPHVCGEAGVEPGHVRGRDRQRVGAICFDGDRGPFRLAGMRLIEIELERLSAAPRRLRAAPGRDRRPVARPTSITGVPVRIDHRWSRNGLYLLPRGFAPTRGG
jgi:hypothetical protein